VKQNCGSIADRYFWKVHTSDDGTIPVGWHTRTVARLQLQRFNYDNDASQTGAGEGPLICGVMVQFDPRDKARS